MFIQVLYAPCLNRDGATVISLGTSGTIFAKSPTAILDPTGVPLASLAGAVLVICCCADGLSCCQTAIFRENLPLLRYPELHYAHPGAPPAAAGVICPFCDATGNYLPLLCTLNCTRVLEEVRGWFGGRTGPLRPWRQQRGRTLLRQRAGARPATKRQ